MRAVHPVPQPGLVDQADTCGTQGRPHCGLQPLHRGFRHAAPEQWPEPGRKNRSSTRCSCPPIGESQLGRVNNIIIYEEGGGYWDRIDAEYSLTDQWILTGELNLYWGD